MAQASGPTQLSVLLLLLTKTTTLERVKVPTSKCFLLITINKDEIKREQSKSENVRKKIHIFLISCAQRLLRCHSQREQNIQILARDR